MAIDWETRLLALGGDTSPVAVGVRFRVTQAGGAYDRAGAPSVGGETAAHAQWRGEAADTLRQWDRLAASVDGLPVGTVDDANPLAAQSRIAPRLRKAALSATPAGRLAASIVAIRPLPLPREPEHYDAAYYVKGAGEIEMTLRNALAELDVYLAIRT